MIDLSLCVRLYHSILNLSLYCHVNSPFTMCSNIVSLLELRIQGDNICNSKKGWLQVSIWTYWKPYNLVCNAKFHILVSWWFLTSHSDRNLTLQCKHIGPCKQCQNGVDNIIPLFVHSNIPMTTLSIHAASLNPICLLHHCKGNWRASEQGRSNAYWKWLGYLC